MNFSNFEFPDALTGVLGAVIGFYFGSRSSSRGEEALSNQVKQLQADRSQFVAERNQAVGERDKAVTKRNRVTAEREQAVTERDKAIAEREQAIAEKDTGQTDTLLKKVQKGINLTKTVATLLPKNVRNKYDDLIDKLEQGVKTVEDLKKSNVTEAAAKAAEAFGLFKTSNPVRDIVEKASKSFGRVLGSAVPSFAIISAVVGVSAKLVGVVYQKWKARILHLPFSPAVVPLEVVDANTGFSLFLQSPIFKSAFIKELEEND